MVEKVITESLQQRLQDLFVYRPLGHQLPCHQAAAYYYNGLMLHKIKKNMKYKNKLCLTIDGSNTSEVEKSVLDQKIAEKELLQINGFFQELEVCRTNQEQEYDLDPDETDSFMMQGIVRDISEVGDGEDSQILDSVD
ncbi:hypothetical protein AgCh_012804 [Apium graveolens]